MNECINGWMNERTNEGNNKQKCFAIGRFRLVGVVGRKIVIGLSNSFYVVFCSILAPIPDFNQVLVGRAGRSKNGCRHFKHSESVLRLSNDLLK